MFQTVLHLECHQQRSFTLKMHQNRWRLGPHYEEAYSAPPGPLAGLRGLLLRGGEEKGGEIGERLWTLTILDTD